MTSQAPLRGWRRHAHEVIFEADTPAGKLFDVGLLLTIVISIVAVCLESVNSIEAEHGTALRRLEWALTLRRGGGGVNDHLRQLCLSGRQASDAG